MHIQSTSSAHLRNKGVICTEFSTTRRCSFRDCPFAHIGADDERPLPTAVCSFFQKDRCLRDECGFFHGREDSFKELLATARAETPRRLKYQPAKYMEARDARTAPDPSTQPQPQPQQPMAGPKIMLYPTNIGGPAMPVRPPQHQLQHQLPPGFQAVAFPGGMPPSAQGFVSYAPMQPISQYAPPHIMGTPMMFQQHPGAAPPSPTHQQQQHQQQQQAFAFQPTGVFVHPSQPGMLQYAPGPNAQQQPQQQALFFPATAASGDGTTMVPVQPQQGFFAAPQAASAGPMGSGSQYIFMTPSDGTSRQ